jgi:copper oxidase (laccase) domain-containing protein
MICAAYGWRGLAHGVLGALLHRLLTGSANLIGWMGLGIGLSVEVG